MKKFLMCLIACVMSVCVFADTFTVQCKMKMEDGKSSVVASYDNSTGKIVCYGYGRAANSAVVVRMVGKEYTVRIVNGTGEIQIGNIVVYVAQNMTVGNIVCK